MLDLISLSREELLTRVEAERRLRTEADAARKEVEARYERLSIAYREVKEELALVKRRIFLARAERVDTTQLELEFGELARKLDAIVRERDGEKPAGDDDSGSGPKGSRNHTKPKGRRPVVDENHPADVRIRIEDPVLAGAAREVGVETSYRIGYQRPKLVRIAVDRVKYELASPGENPTIVIASVPAECMRRGLLAPSMIARILLQKFSGAIPFHRQSKMLAADGIDLDDGTMCRYAEHVGATLGTVVPTCSA